MAIFISTFLNHVLSGSHVKFQPQKPISTESNLCGSVSFIVILIHSIKSTEEFECSSAIQHMVSTSEGLSSIIRITTSIETYKEKT